jgi:hypothetical protein
MAAQKNHEDVVKAGATVGADMNVPNNCGLRSLSIAAAGATLGCWGHWRRLAQMSTCVEGTGSEACGVR